MEELEKLGFVQLPAFSPFIKHNGPFLFRLTRQDRFEIAIKITPEHTNPLGTCHGGMMMTFVDAVMGGVVSYDATPQKMTPAVSIICNFIRSAMLGDSVIASAQVSRCTNSLAFATCVVCTTSNPDSSIITANGIYSLPQNPTTGFDMKKTMREAYAHATGGNTHSLI